MKSDGKEDTINKSILLNWLNSADQEVSLAQLGQFLRARTKGRYSIVKSNEETDTPEMTDFEIKNINDN